MGKIAGVRVPQVPLNMGCVGLLFKNGNLRFVTNNRHRSL